MLWVADLCRVTQVDVRAVPFLSTAYGDVRSGLTETASWTHAPSVTFDAIAADDAFIYHLRFVCPLLH